MCLNLIKIQLLIVQLLTTCDPGLSGLGSINGFCGFSGDGIRHIMIE